MRALYLECTSGISGDMAVAALLDLGVDPEGLRTAVGSLGIGGYSLGFGLVDKNGLQAVDFDVRLEAHDHHDHDRHDHDHHDHVHRGLPGIRELIDGSDLTPRAKALAQQMFLRVARAEAQVHGKPIEEVHFHEVGAVDSIVDIVGVAYCLDQLGFERAYCSALSEGQGTVHCQHGVMPVPAPATVKIASEGGLILQLCGEEGEMVTPTGAAIAATLNAGLPPAGFRIERIGYGAGKKTFRRANLLRAYIIEVCADEAPDSGAQAVVELACNLDDMTGEHLGYAMERLLEAGALDVWFTSIQMKKNRPGVLLSVLCDPSQTRTMQDCMFRHTGTLGVRVRSWQREIMERQQDMARTPYGEVAVKRAVRGELARVAVEYESARRTALARDIPLDLVYRAAEACLHGGQPE